MFPPATANFCNITVPENAVMLYPVQSKACFLQKFIKTSHLESILKLATTSLKEQIHETERNAV
ncbi:hypothetical protein C8U37_10611 [Trichococcus patagoniensis]|uniref:Uncharacterized protein n=1 Tax=Trichococcus patagoniensis TaxID=382641 RepID=A0A2T5IM27_9LACT|nr:hypothetical protein C8U37_10611 [Trichococcus patagoniensis]